MLNTKLFNFHDLVLITALVIVVHYFAHPLYQRIDGASAQNTPPVPGGS